MPGPGRGLGPGFLTDEEKENLPKVDKKLLIRILSYLKPYRFQFVFVFLAILLSAVVGLLPSIITGKIVDEALINRDIIQCQANLLSLLWNPHRTVVITCPVLIAVQGIDLQVVGIGI